jgi:hypothetical protein
MSGRIEPVRRRAWGSAPVQAITPIVRRDPREHDDDDEASARREPPKQPGPPDDGRPHVDIRV